MNETKSILGAAAVKTAVIGASGFIGGHLWRAYRLSYPDSFGTSFSAANPDLSFFDIRQPNLRSLRLEENGYGAVLIASAKPNVAFCEQQPDAAYAVNVRGTLELLRQIGRTSLQAIFLSSEYVFDGVTGRYPDDAETRPATEYGRQKALVEKELPSCVANYLTLRLSKIYGVQQGDGTLLDEMASALTSGREIRAASDQVFCPTYIDDLVRSILAIQARGLRGVLNVCGPEAWRRYDIGIAVANALGVDTRLVKDVRLHELPGMAGRPLNTSMICPRLTHEVQPSFTPLDESMRRLATNWRSERTTK